MHNNLKTDTKMYAAVVEVTTLVDPFSHTQEPFSAWSAMLNYFWTTTSKNYPWLDVHPDQELAYQYAPTTQL